jgi:colanic acid/amylovoran biosynthesis glycosyltransferase
MPSRSRLFFYSYWTDEGAVALMLVKKKHPRSVVFSRMHRWDLYFEGHPASYLPYRPALFKRTDAIFVISEHGRDYLRQKMGAGNCERLVLSRLGTKRQNGRIHNDSRPFRLLSCSSVIARKRVWLIAEAIAMIGDVQIRWDHLGGGAEAKSLQERADALFAKRENISCYLHGPKDNAGIYEYYRSEKVDLFINVSEDEGVPVSIMEAMSFGVPVIATAVGGTPEIVTDHYNGFLLPAHPAPREVADAITRFTSLTDEQKAEFRRHSLQTWSDKFDADRNYRDFVEKIMNL